MNKVLSIKFKNSILAFILFISMMYGYIVFVYPMFNYSGFQYTWDTMKVIESFVLFFITLIFISTNLISKFMYSVNMLVLLFMTMPNYVIYMFMNIPRAIPYSYFFMHLILILLSMTKINFKSYIISEKYESKVMIGLTIIMLIPFIITYGTHLNLKVLIFQDIYKVRDYSTRHNNILTGYFYSWLTNSVTPFLIIYGYVKKNYKYIIFGVITILYLYIIAAHKSVFFGLVMLLFLNLFKGYERKIFIIYLVMTSVVILGIAIFLHNGNISIASMFLRRVFFIPALLNKYYFEFFDHNHIYLAHSIFKHFIDYPYTMRPDHLIGATYFHNPNMGANNGIVSDGFMNFGYVGVAINIFIFGMIMKFFESVNINELLFPLIYAFIFSLNSGALLVVLLTHGLIVFILMVLFFNKRLNLLQEKNNENKGN